MMGTFTCEKCGYVGESRSEEELVAEYKANFGAYATDCRGSLCDTCYEEFWNWAKRYAPELTRKR